MDFPNRKYSIIYADPPWSYRDKPKGCADEHYPTMNIQDIKNLPVQEISKDNSILFIWCTAPMLPEVFDVISCWGFTYKTVGFTWVKKNKIKDSWFMGIGHWTRSNAEFCLLATRGKPERKNKGIISVIDSKIEKHSKKPYIVREKIVELCGNKSRIELFAREKIKGWHCWGNEINIGM